MMTLAHQTTPKQQPDHLPPPPPQQQQQQQQQQQLWRDQTLMTTTGTLRSIFQMVAGLNPVSRFKKKQIIIE